MKKMFLLLILILIVCSCVSSNSSDLTFEKFYAKSLNDWIYADFVSDISQKGVISRPVGINVLLFQINFPDSAHLKHESNCVYYIVPFKKIIGELIIVENKEMTSCSENISGEILYKLSNINSLELIPSKFNLKISLTVKNKSFELKYPFYNLKDQSKHEKFREEVENRLKTGMILLRNGFKNSLNSQKNYIGLESDSFSRKTSIRCQKVDKDCNTVGESFCGRCKFGYFEVVDFQCPQGGSKYCGTNHCGSKNEPACPRGNKFNENEIDGICEENLNLVENSENILICQ